ncbi:COMM domain-containing protein 8 isoform X2 [Falco peregrinus]|uniref:COMM domain-containing protein 8 isoform X2 n=2 Tax=Falco TaxID=8952 RepID=UPI002478FF0D|nr:COMM domain-containing protein 8 isoform X2 [Falco peregrinus]
MRAAAEWEGGTCARVQPGWSRGRRGGGGKGREMLSLLEKLPPGRALEFLHKIVDGICGRAYPRYQDYGTIWSLSEWMEILEETMTYFKTAVGKNISDEEAAQQINELNSNYQEAITKCLKGRKEEIRNALVEKVNAISSAQLQDFDWQLKLALSSDKLSMLQMPLLNLDLDVRENGEIKPVSIEMNKEELQNLINALEAANKVVLQLK